MSEETDFIHLQFDHYTADISPVVGASLMNWKKDGTDLMRPATSAAVAEKQADQTTMFPLVPYSNRIRGGYFIYWGIKRTVPKNHPVVADPLHGEGWQREWNIVSKSENTVELSFEHNGKNGFPFAYEARETFKLTDGKLETSLALTNNGGIPMPCGLGFHPFFFKDDDTILTFKSKNVWAHEIAPPRERPIKTPPEWQFDKGLPVKDIELDTCFGGWDGKAEIIYPSRKQKISMTAYSDFGHIVIWTPSGENFFCVEPVTNANDAFNLASRGIAGTGIKTLDPEESLTETMTLAVSDL